MFKRLVLGSFLLAASLLLQACGGTTAATPSTATTAAPASGGNPLNDLIAAANKEGKVKLYINSSSNEQWVRKFEQAFNETYGTKISITSTPGGNFTS